MRKIWKEIVILCGFIAIFILLVFEHEQHINGIVIREIPYILILIVTVVFVLWGIDKVKQYQMSSHTNDKLRHLANQYDLNYDEKKSTIHNSDIMLDEINQLLKKDELNISTFEYRYRLLANLTNQTIFEYNIKNHTICDSNDWRAIADGKRFIDNSISKGIIHPDDAILFRQFFQEAQVAGQFNDVLIHVRYHKDEEYQQTRLRGVVLGNIDGNPEKIVGTRTTIDSQK